VLWIIILLVIAMIVSTSFPKKPLKLDLGMRPPVPPAPPAQPPSAGDDDASRK
jgi:hypothetical protein